MNEVSYDWTGESCRIKRLKIERAGKALVIKRKQRWIESAVEMLARWLGSCVIESEQRAAE